MHDPNLEVGDGNVSEDSTQSSPVVFKLVTVGGMPGIVEPAPMATFYHLDGKRPLLFLVTGVGTRSIWNHLAPELHSLGCNVCSYQQPGFSGDPTELLKYDLECFVASFQNAFFAAATERASTSSSLHVVGHSFGAVVSLCAAESLVDIVDSFQLISPALAVCPKKRRQEIGKIRNKAPHRRVLEEVTLYRKPPHEFLDLLLRSGQTAAERIHAVSCPTWLYEGAMDDRVAPASGELQARFVDLRKVSVLENSGHFVPMDWDADRLVAEIHAAVASF